jgi:hypothetical protein
MVQLPRAEPGDKGNIRMWTEGKGKTKSRRRSKD